jgi:hypothetical protein
LPFNVMCLSVKQLFLKDLNGKVIRSIVEKRRYEYQDWQKEQDMDCVYSALFRRKSVHRHNQ